MTPSHYVLKFNNRYIWSTYKSRQKWHQTNVKHQHIDLNVEMWILKSPERSITGHICSYQQGNRLPGDLTLSNARRFWASSTLRILQAHCECLHEIRTNWQAFWLDVSTLTERPCELILARSENGSILLNGRLFYSSRNLGKNCNWAYTFLP